jgi:hypothetical protein
MSFSGGTKGHRQEQPLSKDYNTPVAEMETNHILKSTIQRSLESGQVDDDIDVEWAKVVVSAGLPMSLFDKPEVRKTVLMTTGQNLVECLVHSHTNLKLEQRLEMYEVGLLPWDTIFLAPDNLETSFSKR